MPESPIRSPMKSPHPGHGGGGLPTVVPVNLVAPQFFGPLTVGQAEITTNGTWSQAPTSFLYQHQISPDGVGTWTDIVGATSQMYSPVVGDVGKYLRPGVKGVNGIGPALAFANGPAVGPIVAALSLSGTPSSTGTVGVAYTTFTPTFGGGHTPYVFTLTGTLPGGLSLNSSTGVISGTPTTAETASGLNITMTDANGLTVSLGTFSITVSAAAGSPGQLDWSNTANTGFLYRLGMT